MWGNVEFTSESECTSCEVEEELTNLQYQTGRVEVGAKENDGEESMRIEINFNHDFQGEDAPVVFVCPEGEPGQDYADVFGATVIEESVSHSGFNVNIGRMAKQESFGWGQNLHLNWIAVDSNSPLLQTVIVEAGPKEDEDAESIGVEVRFPQPFPHGRKPAVFATCYGADYPDTFAVCVQHSSRKRAHLNICRGIGGGWGQNVKVAVLATNIFPSVLFDCGSGEGERDVAFPELEFPGGMARKPMLFTVGVHAQGSRFPDAFVCSPANVTNTSFQMNLQRGHPVHNGWGQNLRAQVILIP